MFRNVMTVALAGAAIVATPAIAQRTPGGSPNAAAIGARINSQGPANASVMGTMRASPNSVLRTNPVTPVVQPTVPPVNRATNSQGLIHASPNAIARANSNSVLARGAVAATALPGLTTGLTVQNTSGTSLGTVSQIVTGTDGSIRMVVVTTPQGQTYRLPATSLSISGGVVTTTSTTISG